MTDATNQAYPSGKYGGGFTKREAIAKDIMAAIITNLGVDSLTRQNAERWAEDALIATDALITELNKTS